MLLLKFKEYWIFVNKFRIIKKKFHKFCWWFIGYAQTFESNDRFYRVRYLFANILANWRNYRLEKREKFFTINIFEKWIRINFQIKAIISLGRINFKWTRLDIGIIKNECRGCLEIYWPGFLYNNWFIVVIS